MEGLVCHLQLIGDSPGPPDLPVVFGTIDVSVDYHATPVDPDSLLHRSRGGP